MALKEAISYAITDDASWAFHRLMSHTDRQAFDEMLVTNKHPLAYEPGTTEGRFYQYISEQRQRTQQ